MSHSLRRATRELRLKAVFGRDDALRRPDIAARSPYLRAAFEKQSIEQQQNHGADDRHDPASDVITARKDATDPCPYQRACDTEQNRDDATAGIFARHQKLCDRADNETNKNSPDD